MFDVITIGTATRDVFLRSSLFQKINDPHFRDTKVFPTGVAECFPFGGKVDIDELLFAVGGGAANAAVTFARQGLTTATTFAVGRDEAGRVITQGLRAEHITVSPTVVPSIGTAYSTLLLSHAGERTVLVYRGAADELRILPKPLLKTQWAYIAPGGIPFEFISVMVSQLVAHGVRIVLNPSGHYVRMEKKVLAPFLLKTAVLIVNREEAAALTSVPYKETSTMLREMDKLTSGIVVVTDGPNGVMVSDHKCLYKAGIFHEQKIVDRTGAGDAFGSGFVAGLMQRAKMTPRVVLRAGPEGFFNKILSISEVDICDAIRLGSANATSVVERIGAHPGILTRQQFMRSPRWKELHVEVMEL